MPSDVEGQRKQRSSEIAARASKKIRAAKRRAEKKKEKQDLKEAGRLAVQQAKKDTRNRKTGNPVDVLPSTNAGEPHHKYHSSELATNPTMLRLDAAPIHEHPQEAQPANPTSNPSATKTTRKRPRQQVTDDEDSDEEAASRLHPDDPDNFVKLSTALRLLLSRELEEDDIETADELLREYCTELIEVDTYTCYLRFNHC